MLWPVVLSQPFPLVLPALTQGPRGCDGSCTRAQKHGLPLSKTDRAPVAAESRTPIEHFLLMHSVEQKS